MIPRTFRLAVVCALFAVQVVWAETRLSVSGGVNYPLWQMPFTFGFSESPNGPVLPTVSINADAPSVIRRHLPVEAMVETAWLHDPESWYDDYGNQRGWQRDGYLVTSEAVRVYATRGLLPEALLPSGLDVGLGIGVYQFWPYMKFDGESHKSLRHPHVQWRGHGFARYNFHPASKTGLVFEFELQRVFDDVHENGFPRGALNAKLGYRFHV